MNFIQQYPNDLIQCSKNNDIKLNDFVSEVYPLF